MREYKKDKFNPELLKSLHNYQIDALKFISDYLDKKSVKKQCLIKLPTGTGKSVLISIISQFYNDKTCLVIAPSIAIKDQLLTAVNSKTWTNLNYNKKIPKNVVDLKKVNYEKFNFNSQTVIITTIQKLISLNRTHPEFIMKLKKHIKYIIFDEGHREPANEWSQLIRKLTSKIVLFTATPNRNDANKFEFDDNIFSLSIEDAIDMGYIRQIEFQKIQTCENIFLPSMIKGIIQEYIETYGCLPQDSKMIIRCKDKDNIIKLTKLLNEHHIKTVGIHDTFKSFNSLYHDYANIDDLSSIECFIHQNKLIEGIDNNQFSIIFFYDSFNTDRSTIQQIGRVLRKQSNNDFRKALIVSFNNKEEKVWENYLSYEKDINNLQFKFQDFHNKILKSTPKSMYNKTFLNKFEISDTLVLERFQIPKITNVFDFISEKKKSSEVFENILHSIENTFLSELDNLVLNNHVDRVKNEIMFAYATYDLNKYLVNEIYIEPKLEIIVCKFFNGRLYFYSTEGKNLDIDSSEWRRVDGNLLIKLFKESDEFNMASIKNGSVSINSYNRMTINSNDITRLVPDISDRFNFLTVAQGKHKKFDNKVTKRYVGFNNGRISEREEIVNIKTYFEWIEELDSHFNSNNKHFIFSRYAPITKTPSDTSPIFINIILEDETHLRDYEDELILLNNRSIAVKNNEFTISFSDYEFEVEIQFNISSNKYYLIAANTSERNILYKNEEIFRYLNRTQSFLIMLKNNSYKYYAGHFYELGVPAIINDLDSILDENNIDMPKTDKITEKGETYKSAKDAPKKSIWDRYSLFNLIATQGADIKNDSKLKNLLSNAEYILCTDLNKEVADFVIVSEKTNEVAFIHCKAGSSLLSASAFQEVCGQITKNLDYVHNASNRKPPDLYDWDNRKESWSISTNGTNINRKILNKDNKKAFEIWDILKSIQLKPDSKTYVIAFIGDVFSKSKYDIENNKTFDKQSPEKIQIDYILLETALAVSRVNAQLLVSYTYKISN